MSYNFEEVNEALQVIEKIDFEISEKSKVSTIILNYLIETNDSINYIVLEENFVNIKKLCSQEILKKTIEELVIRGFIYQPFPNCFKAVGGFKKN